jgi:hypothetical protein
LAVETVEAAGQPVDVRSKDGLATLARWLDGAESAETIRRLRGPVWAAVTTNLERGRAAERAHREGRLGKATGWASIVVQYAVWSAHGAISPSASRDLTTVRLRSALAADFAVTCLRELGRDLGREAEGVRESVSAIYEAALARPAIPRLSCPPGPPEVADEAPMGAREARAAMDGPALELSATGT